MPAGTVVEVATEEVEIEEVDGEKATRTIEVVVAKGTDDTAKGRGAVVVVKEEAKAKAKEEVGKEVVDTTGVSTFPRITRSTYPTTSGTR